MSQSSRTRNPTPTRLGVSFYDPSITIDSYLTSFAGEHPEVISGSLISAHGAQQGYLNVRHLQWQKNYRNYTSYSNARESEPVVLCCSSSLEEWNADGGAANRFSTFALIFIPPTISYGGLEQDLKSTGKIIEKTKRWRLRSFDHALNCDGTGNICRACPSFVYFFFFYFLPLQSCSNIFQSLRFYVN